jgi:hypothetical protein
VPRRAQRPIRRSAFGGRRSAAQVTRKGQDIGNTAKAKPE